MAVYSELWRKCYLSICAIIFKNSKGEVLGSGTGFKSGRYLVTNNHVFAARGAVIVELKFVDIDGYTTKIGKRLTYAEFSYGLQSGDSETGWDFAIIDVSSPEFDSIPALELENGSIIDIGDPVAVLGYQFDQTNLSIKKGILSSRFVRAGVKYLQLDVSINQGNSGGPLINVNSGKVVGIVTRKHTGLTDAFDNLLKSIDDNLEVIAKTPEGISISGLDPRAMAMVSQNQLKLAALELKRSANVGIGYAYELEHVLEYIAHNP